MRIGYEAGGEGKKALWQGAALLGGAALLTKLIGTLQKIPLQNLAGDEAFGLYTAVYALAVMWMTLASAGIPAAVSALVAEKTAKGDEEGAARVLRWAGGLLGLLGLAAFLVLWLGAGTFARWMGLEEAAPAIRMSSLALLFSPVTAVLRGDRQGRMQMVGPAVSQLIEQLARVIFMLVALAIALSGAWSASATAAAVHGGLAAGAIAGLLAMARFSAREARRDKPVPDRAVRFPEPRIALVGRIARVAFPVAAASIVAPLFGLIDAFSIPRLLDRDGTWALAQFGVYSRGIALLQLVVLGAAGAAAALVPALTAARARGNEKELASRALFALRLAWWFGCAAAVGLALLAAPINTALFGDDNGSAAMALVGLAAAGGTLQAVSAALLQGLGELRAPAVNLAASALLKLSLNVALVPQHGIEGAAAAMAIAYAVAAILNALSLRQRVPLPAPRAQLAWRSAAALAAMAAAVAPLALGRGGLIAAGLPARAAALLVALPGVVLGAAVFAAALVALGAVAPREWREVPGLSGTRLDRWLLRIRTLTHRDNQEG
ncbi:oligosaccharide flippase family protein [Cohnella hongkongensis]|uniref:Oligosaccharide flippase family protein n=1 Tax=Cohnella hongkongensis TaxID=178337 RepID=A0ABV9FK97_9BACL